MATLNRLEKYKIDLSELKVWDKLWSIQLGECKISDLNATQWHISVKDGSGAEERYTEGGCLYVHEAFPSLFTSNPFAEEAPNKSGYAYNPEPVGLTGGKPESILQEAERIINGDRQEAYGDAYENFTNIATGWEVIFRDGFTAEKVSLAMCWLKTCRFINKADRDSIVDIAGYAGCVEKIQKGGTK